MPHQVLSANPDGSCTHNATVCAKDDTNSEVAKLEYRRFKEEGTIKLTHSAQTYNVLHKTGSGIWRLQLDDPHSENNPPIVATKPKWYRNWVTFEMDGRRYEMIRPSLKKRDYLVGLLGEDDVANASTAEGDKKDIAKEKQPKNALSGKEIGQLFTDGTFKRSYTITFDQDIRIELPLFCYWMVSLFNKRSNESNNAAGSGAGAC